LFQLLADLVEEGRAPLGLLQLAWVAGVGPGEGAPPVAEQLTFQQAVGQGRAGSELRMKERS
jgi:hypothetical protein